MGTSNLSALLFVIFSSFLSCSSHKQSGPELGILQGTVTIGPLRPGPVRRDDPPVLPTRLFATHKIAILSSDAEMKIAEAEIDASGNYRIELPPGKYLVEMVPNDIGMRKARPSPVVIEAGQTVTFDLDIDTGMR